eukprot:s4494_g9.t1
MLLPSQKFITLTLNLFKLASQGVRYALIALNILPKLSLHLGLYLRRRGENNLLGVGVEVFLGVAGAGGSSSGGDICIA